MDKKITDLINQHNSILKQYNGRSNMVGSIKLLLTLWMGATIFFIFSKPTLLPLIACGITLIVLITFWVYHNKLQAKIDYTNGKIAIYQRHLDRRAGAWTAFSDIGEEYIDPEHPYACDLDLVGKQSFFQFLNTTHTWHGRQAFSNDLLAPHYTPAEINKRQQAISELSQDMDFSSDLEYHFSKIGTDGSVQTLVQDLADQQLFFNNKAVKTVLIYLPFLTITLLALAILFKLNRMNAVGISLIFLQTVMWTLGIPKTQNYLRLVSRLPYQLSAYGTIIDMIKERSFDSVLLKNLQFRLNTPQASASQAIKELGTIADKISVRSNAVIYFVLNILLLWDFECAFLYEGWKNRYANHTADWFLALGEFESLLSFSVLPLVCSRTCLPDITAGQVIQSQTLGHPLIANASRIYNDISCNNNIFIISGSNMSGKTTFLRTIGINLVLSYAGSFVCADKMQCSQFTVMTSMRIADDLNSGVSTFYAELKRIKKIIEQSKTKPDIFFLIDEIFRGTNSTDRLSGARTIISKLNQLAVSGMISTHDLELCTLEKTSGRIINCHFSEYYQDDQIFFDYKLKTGISTTTNALFLMKMVGII